ncbi:MAG TPA: hypothetical protein VHU84_16005, partial [Lacipirellulaceae bacterium]|nr:hypothetical protein [Lacipirellulaceae bacterium]
MMSDPASDFNEQYQALRDGRGIVELVGWSSISVSGADRHSFLHNFCTNDIKRLAPGASCEAFFLNVKGKIVGHGIVSCREDELVVIGVPGQARALVAHLDRYLIREDVQLRDTSAERDYVLAVGNPLIENEQLRAMQAAHDLAIVPCNFTGSEVEQILEVPSEVVDKSLSLLQATGAMLA